MQIEKINEKFGHGAKRLIAHRWWVLLIFAIAIAFAFNSMRHMVKKSTFDDYFMEDDPVLKMTDEFKSHFGNDYFVGVLTRCDDHFTHDNLQQLRKLCNELMDSLSYAEKITSLTDIEFMVGSEDGMTIEQIVPDEIPTSTSALDSVRMRAYSKPNVARKLVSADGKLSWILVKLRTFPEDSVWKQTSNIAPDMITGAETHRIITKPEYASLHPLATGMPYTSQQKVEYINHAMNSVNVDLTGMKIVVDCAEGAAFYTSVETLKELGGTVVAIHNSPDGTNINANCGSTHMEELQARVVYEKADLGLAFDGDADRLLAVDENGRKVDGDQIMAIIGNYMKESGKLANDTIVATVMSNLGFFLMAEKYGIHMEQTKVGDRYVLERMKEIHANLGGEQSGHIIFLDENTTGDGLLSALHLLQVMADTKKPLSELASIMEVLPQALVNAQVANHKKEKYLEYPQIAEAIAALEKKFAGEGRVLIRPSGTEPLVRVMIEGKDQQVIQEEAEKLAGLIQDVMF